MSPREELERMSDNALKRLAWDSDFLGYPIGALRAGDGGGLDIEGHLARARQAGLALVYIFIPPSNEQAIQALDHCKEVKLADRKLIFSRTTAATAGDARTGSQPAEAERIVSWHGGLDEALLELALQSGVYSRFKTDPSFRNQEYEKIYTEWIRKSVTREIADELLVYKDEAERSRGLVTLKRDAGVAEIGLLATHAACRGRGIGTLLIEATLRQARQWDCPRLQVATQRANAPACAFYQRNGFTVREEIYIYHWWNG